jgi:carboxyl-terminal processing protease
VILHERDAEDQLRTYQARSVRGWRVTIPIIAMINQGTASAGEITAGALQGEWPRPAGWGSRRTGTGTVLQPFTLSDGSVLRLGVTNWLTPDENLIKNQLAWQA